MSDEVEANYNAMHVAADAGDAEQAKQLGDAVIVDSEATTEQKAYANWRVGDTLARAGRNADAKPYLQQAAALGDADVQERAYQLLADMAQFEDASSGDYLGTKPLRRIAAAKEAIDRSDPEGALDLASQVFDDDEADTVQKAAASLIAAEANFSLGRDDHAELYANWAATNGTEEQKEEARTLLARWKGYDQADRSMDDGVTTAERPPILDAAATAGLNQDWPTAQRLLLELNEKEASELTPAQYAEMAYGLGESYFHQAEYQTARGWFAAVPASTNHSDFATEYVERIDQLLQQVQGTQGTQSTQPTQP